MLHELGPRLNSLLVSLLGILLCVLGHMNHLRNRNSIQVTESLEHQQSAKKLSSSPHPQTYIRNGAIRQLSIPLILYLLNLALRIQMDSNHTLNSLLFSNPLDNISRLEVHQNRVSGILDAVVQALNLAKRSLQPVPLRGVLVAALGDGDVVGEGRVVAPERELRQRRPPREQVQHRAYDCALRVGEADAGGGLDVLGLDVEAG
jgi:hypothetical protein